MSDTTIFKLSDLGISGGSIKVKSKKNADTSSFSNTISLQLSAPTISISGDTLTISVVQNATAYEIYNYGTKVAETSNLTYDLSTLNLSNALIGVKAISNIYQPSNMSNVISYNMVNIISTTVSNLGSQEPSNVTFSKDLLFTTSGLGIDTDYVLGTDHFVKIPTMYRKVNTVSDNQITSFTIANAKIDNDYYPYPCFIKEDGETIMPYILIGKYWNTDESGCVSTTEANATHITLANGRTYAKNRGTGYQLFDWMIRGAWQDLIICFKETVNTNSGSGIGTNGYDDLDIFWGGSNGWIDGIIGSSDNWGFCYKPSKYVSLSSTSDPIPADYVTTNYIKPSALLGSISKLGYDSSNPFFNYPSAVTGSNFSTYYCDAYSASSGKYPFLDSVGGEAVGSGVFSCSGTNSWTSSNGVRLCYRPIGN